MQRLHTKFLLLLLASPALLTACDAEILFQTDLRGKTDAIGEDSDEDGISDRDELAHGLDPRTPDAGDDPDGDGLTNIWEIKLGYDPHVADSGTPAGNGVSDCDEDNDGDGAKNCWEINNGFDPLSAADLTLDADADGFSNAEEAVAGKDPKAKEDHPGPTPSFTTADDDLDVAGYTNNKAFRASLGFCNDGDMVLVSPSSDKPLDETGFVACTKAASALKGTLSSATEGDQTVYIWRKNVGGIVDSPLSGIVIYDVTGPKGDLSVISAEVGKSVVTITLPKAADYASQILRRILSSDCTESRPNQGDGLTVEKTTTSVADSGFEASTPQCYRVFWYDVLGNEGGMNAVLAPPPAPIFVSLGFANGAVDTYVNAAERAASTDMPGTLTASNYVTADYKLVALATACDQNLTYAAKPKTDSADFGADGNYKICVKLVGVGGNTTFGESATLKLDTLAPSFTSIALANEALDGVVNIADHALTGDLAGGPVGAGYDIVAYKLAASATTCNVALTYSTMPKSDSTQFGADGNYKVCVKLADAAGNPAAYGETANFNYDVTAPVFGSLPLANEAVGGFVNNAEKAIANNLAGPLAGSSGFTSDSYTVTASTTACSAATGYGTMPQNPAATPDATYKVCAKLADAVGNVTYGSSSDLVRDTSVPSFTSVVLANEAVDLAINIADYALTNDLVSAAVGTGHTSTGYKLVTPATTCNNLLVYGTLPKNNSSDFGAAGNYKVCVKLSDAAGNADSYGESAAFAFSATPPVFGTLPLANEAVGGFLNNAEKAIANNLAGPLAGSSGFTTDTYTVTASTTACSAATGYGTMPQNPAATPDGMYKVCAKLADAAGNVTYGSSSNLVRDTSVPSFTSVALANEAVDLAINIADYALTNDLVATAVGAGHTSTGYKLVTPATTCNNLLVYGALPKNNSSDFGAAGNYKVCVKLSDAAGNADSYGESAAFAFSATAPVFGTLPLANEAVGGFLNNAEKAIANNLAGPLAGSSGFTTDTYTVAASTTACSAATGYGTMPQNPAVTPDGTYKVCAKLADAAGNVTYGSTSNLVRDTTVPSFTSVALANEAVDLTINVADHNLTNDLVAAAVGTGHTSTGYKLVTAATACDNLLVYGTLPTNNSLDFGVDGSYRVCVKLSDAAGNTDSYGASSTFAFDNSSPTFTSLAFANDAVGGYINAAERLLTNDMAGALVGTGYTADTYKLVTSATTCDGSLTYGLNPKSNSTDFPSDGNYKICVKLADAAGNAAYGFTGTLVLDTGVPTFTSLALANEAVDLLIDAADQALTNDLTGAAVGTGHSTTGYALVISTTTCDGALTYSGSVPKNNSTSFTTDGTYKVCARVGDAAGNAAFGPTSNFSFVGGTVTCTRSVGHNYYYEGTAVTLTYGCDSMISTVTNPDSNKPSWLTVTSAMNASVTQVTLTGTAPSVTGATVVLDWDLRVNGRTTTVSPLVGGKIRTAVIDSASLASTISSAGFNAAANTYNYAVTAGAVFDLAHNIILDTNWDGAAANVVLTIPTIDTDLTGLTGPGSCGVATSPYICYGSTVNTSGTTYDGNGDLKWRWSAWDQGTYYLDVNPRVVIEGATTDMATLGAGTGNFAVTVPIQTNSNPTINDTGDTDDGGTYNDGVYTYGTAFSTDAASVTTAPIVGLVYTANNGTIGSFFRKVVPDRTASPAAAVAITQPAANSDLIMNATDNLASFNLRSLPSGAWVAGGSVASGGPADLYVTHVNAAGSARSKEEKLTNYSALLIGSGVVSSDISESFNDGGTTRIGIGYVLQDDTTNYIRVAKANPAAAGSMSDDAQYAAGATAYQTASIASNVDRVRMHYKSESGTGRFYVAYRQATDLKVLRVDAANGSGYNAQTGTLATGAFLDAGTLTNPQSLDFALGNDGSDTVVGTVYRKNADSNCYFSSVNWPRFQAGTVGYTSPQNITLTAGLCYNPSVHFNPASGRFVITYAERNGGTTYYDLKTTEVTVSGTTATQKAGYPVTVVAGTLSNLTTFPRNLVTQFNPAFDWMAVFYRENTKQLLKLHGYHVPRR